MPSAAPDGRVAFAFTLAIAGTGAVIILLSSLDKFDQENYNAKVIDIYQKRYDYADQHGSIAGNNLAAKIDLEQRAFLGQMAKEYQSQALEEFIKSPMKPLGAATDVGYYIGSESAKVLAQPSSSDLAHNNAFRWFSKGSDPSIIPEGMNQAFGGLYDSSSGTWYTIDQHSGSMNSLLPDGKSRSTPFMASETPILCRRKNFSSQTIA